MNHRQFARSVGKQVRLRAKAAHLGDDYDEIDSPDDDWTIESYDGGIVALRNLRTGSSGVVADDGIYDRRAKQSSSSSSARPET